MNQFFEAVRAAGPCWTLLYVLQCSDYACARSTGSKAANSVDFYIDFKFEFKFSLFYKFEFNIFIFASSSSCSSPVKIYQVFASSENKVIDLA